MGKGVRLKQTGEWHHRGPNDLICNETYMFTLSHPPPPSQPSNLTEESETKNEEEFFFRRSRTFSLSLSSEAEQIFKFYLNLCSLLLN